MANCAEETGNKGGYKKNIVMKLQIRGYRECLIIKVQKSSKIQTVSRGFQKFSDFPSVLT